MNRLLPSSRAAFGLIDDKLRAVRKYDRPREKALELANVPAPTAPDEMLESRLGNLKTATEPSKHQ